MTPASQNIVVAVRDEVNGRRALQRALTLALSGEDSFHLVHAQRAPELTRVAERLQPRWIDFSTDQAGEGWLERLAAQARAQGYRVQCALLSGAPGTAVAEYARGTRADVIVVASPREGLARELFIGSTALRILRAANCPVLVARNDPAQPCRTALVAVDNDAMAGRVVAVAGRFFSGAKIDLVHAYQVPEEHIWRMRGASEEEIAKLRLARRPDIEHALQAITRQLPQAILHIEPAFATSAILEWFDHLKPDVVVIGKHSGSALGEQLTGSVTQFLLYACNTDFLLVT